MTLKNVKLSKDNVRNLQVLLTGAILNFSFALEKLFIICGNPQNDVVWFCIYGGLGVIVCALALYDYIQDIHESNVNEVRIR